MSTEAAPEQEPASRGLLRLASHPQPRLYLAVLLVGTLLVCLWVLRNQTVFACPMKYDADHYLAYCHADHFGDYDHGAFWFDLEPGMRETASRADVLFLGSSRMQFGFSSDALDHWFAEQGRSHYLLGFAYWENYLFEGPLLHSIKASPKAIVINLDTFFEDKLTAPAEFITHDAGARERYESKRTWQDVHRRVCSAVSWICGDDQAFYRSRSTGEYRLNGGRIEHATATYVDTVDEKLREHYVARAREFIAGLPVPKDCVLLTIVPTIGTPTGTAKAIAHDLGTELIAPPVEDIVTFDRSHMERSSAERWSQAFLGAAGPRLQECLAR